MHRPLCLTALLLSISVLVVVPAYAKSPAPLYCIVFELDPEYLAAPGVASADWLSSLPPVRDAFRGESLIQSLHLPVVAKENPRLSGIFQLTVDDPIAAEDYLRLLSNLDGVLWAEPDPVRFTCGLPSDSHPRVDAPPNDPYFPLQWSLDKISAPSGWDFSVGDTSVVIAVVDVGVDIDHNDLIQKRWKNSAENNGQSGVDDDQNGFIDDVWGWDFYDDDADPRPGGTDNHGTHVAGIAAAATDNGYGMAGVAWNCRIMPLRTGSGRTIYRGYEGVVYAVAMGADIINLSWGSNTPSNVERLTTEYAADEGALIVAAAGNSGASNPRPFEHFPAGYPAVLAVTATDGDDRIASISNYNAWVDICAPGVEILSSVPGRSPSDFAVATGTSMSTPIVTGAAALVKSLHPTWTPEQIRLQLILSADPIENLSNNSQFADSIGHGRLNLYRALADQQPGMALTELEIVEGENADHDGVIEAREEVYFYFTVSNLLTRPASIACRILCEDPLLDQTGETVDFGSIEPGASARNDLNPFEADISRVTNSGHEFQCQLRVEGASVEPQLLPFSFKIEPEFLTHRNGNIAFTVTNFGALGYYNYLDRESEGEGLRYPAEGLPALFHGSVMVGQAPDKVSDCAFGDVNDIRYDFLTLTPEFKLIEHEGGVVSATARYNDDGSRRPLNISITQRSVTYSNPPDDDFLLISYIVRNDGLFALDGLRLAMFLDWDVIQSTRNQCHWDAEEGLGWMSHVGAQFPVFGAAQLSGSPGFAVAIDNGLAWPNGTWSRWSDDAKWQLMEAGFEQAENLAAADYSQLLGVAPFTLEAGASSDPIGFAILAGDDAEDLKQNLTAARNRWNGTSILDLHPGAAGDIRLLSLYPQPFNSRVNLVIGNLKAGEVNWRVYDPSGRLVRLGAVTTSASEELSLPLDFENYPTGRYWISVRQDRRVLTAPVTVVK